MDYVGVYVAALRDSKGLTQPDFALKVGVSERTVRNIEAGRHAPRTTDLDNILDYLQGSWTHVEQLLRPGATKALAQKLAQDVINGTGFTSSERSLLENLSPEQKAALLTVARQMRQ